MLCGEVPAAHDRPNQELSGMEPEGEREFGSRVEGAAGTPIFWNLIEGLVLGGQNRGIPQLLFLEASVQPCG